VRLKEAGVDARLCWLGPDDLPTQPVAGRVVVVQRAIADEPLAWVARLHEAGALAVVMELDDDELTGASIDHLAATHPISTADRAELERQRAGLIAMTRACDGVTVSTEPLAEVVRRYTDKPVIVCPNAIDVEWFRSRLAPHSLDPDHLTIGWAGWRRPDADLAPMAEAWARIAARYPDVRFVVAGHQPDVIYRQDIPLDRIIRRPIAPLDEYPTLHQVDIGCCAVADSPFSRCKSPIKAWEYAMAGAAVVATSMLYEDCAAVALPEDTPDWWETALSALVEHADARSDDALWGRLHVEENHSLTANLQRWADAYREIVASTGVPA
jgi:glycosyltransferase involved in cell wall biosynthesis